MPNARVHTGPRTENVPSSRWRYLAVLQTHTCSLGPVALSGSGTRSTHADPRGVPAHRIQTELKQRTHPAGPHPQAPLTPALNAEHLAGDKC